VISVIAIHLFWGDVVAARELFAKEIQLDHSAKSDDCSVIDYVLRGVGNRDGDLLELGQKHFTLQLLKPVISRIICRFKAPLDDEKKRRGTGSAPAAPRLGLDRLIWVNIVVLRAW
jgi:hypothetical protein